MEIAKVIKDAVASAALAIIRSSIGVVTRLASLNDFCQPKHDRQRATETGSQGLRETSFQ
jgi:hypothetical protein